MQATAERVPGTGDVIGRYRLLGWLGEGRSGPLYLAERIVPDAGSVEQDASQRHIAASLGARSLAQTVAVRCIRPQLCGVHGFRERFFEAASVATRCEHPNTVSVLEMAEVHGHYFVSMEYLPGESLATILAEGKLRTEVTPDVAAHLVKRVASAVQYARALGEGLPRPVRGRRVEVDTSNVFVTHGGAIKWLGLVGPPAGVGAASGITRRGWELAPAAIQGDGSVEAFELGMLLWTCLVPDPPGGEGGGKARATKPAHTAMVLRSARADVPDALAAIVLQAVAEDPSRRFQDVAALCDALDAYLLRRDVRTTPEQLRRWLQRSFGPDRAALQLQLAKGRDVSEALGQLRSTGLSAAPSVCRPRPRPLWSSCSSSVAAPARLPQPSPEACRATPNERIESSSQPAGPLLADTRPSRGRQRLRATLVTAGLAASVVLVSSAIGVLATAPAPRHARAADARVDVSSMPPGAAVFVDGEPTGLFTPAVLTGLPPNRAIQVRVAKAGFVPEQRRLAVAPGAVETVFCELASSDGLAIFAGAPLGARVYVDGEEVDVAQPVPLAVGPHAVRVEAAGALTFSERVVIVAGEQTIRVAPGRHR